MVSDFTNFNVRACSLASYTQVHAYAIVGHDSTLFLFC